jgi:hypothetical protein
MATTEEIGAWLSGLGDDVAEIRCRAGVTSKTLEAVGVVEADADAILSAVEDAGYGEVMRLYAYDAKGKQLRTKLFRVDELEAGTSTHGKTTVEVAFAMVDRAMTCVEKLVGGLAEPVQALASMHGAERDRAEDAEGMVMELAQALAKQEAAMERAADQLDANEAGSASESPLKSEALDLVRSVLKQNGLLHDDVQTDSAENDG